MVRSGPAELHTIPTGGRNASVPNEVLQQTEKDHFFPQDDSTPLQSSSREEIGSTQGESMETTAGTTLRLM